MKDVATKALPHGKIPIARVRDADTRQALMQLNENIVSLKTQLAAAQAAIRELQRR